jgi:serine/threonine protein kinase
MGTVYDAIDPLIGRAIALKVIHCDPLVEAAEGSSSRERLFREVRAAGSLLHPGIVVVFDVGQEGDAAFFAMEKVEGASLGQVLASGRKVEVAEALDILRQVASALDYAHEQGIVHRDIKPANIMLASGGTVKVADFSIAKIISAQSRTAAGTVWGTPNYMSPEQIEAGPIDGRSDQFSLGVVAYELLTGAKPFQADSLATLAAMIAYAPRPLACRANPALPLPVNEVLCRGLAKAPQDRFASCGDFVAALIMAANSIRGHSARSNDRKTLRLRIAVPLGAMVAALVLAFWLHQVLFRRGQPGSRPATSTAAKPLVPVASPAPKAIPTHSGDGEPLRQATENAPSVDRAALARKVYDEAVARSDERLLRRAAEMAYPPAMVGLGELYMDNHRERDAAQWFRRAADAGDRSGMLHMGGMYQLGMGVPQDDGAAVRWYRKASGAGEPSAMFDLGAMYESGRGVPADLAKARDLYRRAAVYGNAEAQAALVRLKNN